VAASTLIASLPNPAEPTIVAFGAALGAFIGNAIARVMREEPERRAQRSLDGAFHLTGIALALYLLSNLLRM
jgi:hypothetical protein